MIIMLTRHNEGETEITNYPKFITSAKPAGKIYLKEQILLQNNNDQICQQKKRTIKLGWIETQNLVNVNKFEKS